MSGTVVATVPGTGFCSHSDAAFQPGCPHGMTMAVVTAAHLPLVLPTCSSGSPATFTSTYNHSKSSFPAQVSQNQLLLLAVKNPDSFSKWEKENTKKLLKLKKVMGKGGEAGG